MLFALNIGFENVLPIAIFGLFATVAWWVMGLLSAAKPRTDERLEELKNPTVRRRGEIAAPTKKSPAPPVLAKATPALAAPLLPKTEVEASKIKSKLGQAGFRSETASTVFLGCKLICLLTGLFIGGGTLLLTSGATKTTLM